MCDICCQLLFIFGHVVRQIASNHVQVDEDICGQLTFLLVLTRDYFLLTLIDARTQTIAFWFRLNVNEVLKLHRVVL